jgi:hypothetical protein
MNSKLTFFIAILFLSCNSPAEKEAQQNHHTHTESGPMQAEKPNIATVDFSDTSLYIFTVSDKLFLFRHQKINKTFSTPEQVDSLIQKEGQKLDRKSVIVMDSTKSIKRIHLVIDLLKKNQIMNFTVTEAEQNQPK